MIRVPRLDRAARFAARFAGWAAGFGIVAAIAGLRELALLAAALFAAAVLTAIHHLLTLEERR